MHVYLTGFPSPHSGILFLCQAYVRTYINYFISFPSPHSGILFLYVPTCSSNQCFPVRFRPLIRGFFFYHSNILIAVRQNPPVSVPSFGDSFFIR